MPQRRSSDAVFRYPRPGGANDDGTVFEIAKTAHGYASTPTTLVSFNGDNGWALLGTLIADHHGDLFGTTVLGGSGYGTVFEITGNEYEGRLRLLLALKAPQGW